MTARPQHAGVPAGLRDPEQRYREAARAINGLLLGKSNNVVDVTLGAGVTTTTITDSRITPETAAVLVPTTANAAAALATTYQTAAAGVITLTHANAGTTDRTFRAVLVG